MSTHNIFFFFFFFFFVIFFFFFFFFFGGGGGGVLGGGFLWRNKITLELSTNAKCSFLTSPLNFSLYVNRVVTSDENYHCQKIIDKIS